MKNIKILKPWKIIEIRMKNNFKLTELKLIINVIVKKKYNYFKYSA